LRFRVRIVVNHWAWPDLTGMPNPPNSPYALVADDDFLIRMDAETIPEDAGFRALSTENGVEAIKLLDRYAGSIVLLFTDVEMPSSMCGVTLAERVYGNWPDIRLALTSGRHQFADRDPLNQLGPKPAGQVTM
jgi:CheY-like chemotaxis protein